MKYDPKEHYPYTAGRTKSSSIKGNGEAAANRLKKSVASSMYKKEQEEKNKKDRASKAKQLESESQVSKYEKREKEKNEMIGNYKKKLMNEKKVKKK